MNILVDEKTNPRHTPSINLNLNVRGLKTSATLAINELSAELIAEGRDIINSHGVPPASPSSANLARRCLGSIRSVRSKFKMAASR